MNSMQYSQQRSISSSVTKIMSKTKPSQALVLFPCKRHNDEEAIDLSLRLTVNTTSTANAVSFKSSKKRIVQGDSIRAKRLKKFSFYTVEEEAEEKLNGVCTKLELYHDPWKIKKVLEQSDVNSLCRLMISRRLVQQHIVKVWERAGRYGDVSRLEEGDGVLVKVWDCNRGQEYVLALKKHLSTDCYVFCTNWRSQFVSSRKLKKGDEIGLFWCNLSDIFFFSVLSRAPAQPSV